MRLLIADDEENIRNGIRNCSNWKEVGFDEVFTAADGIEALNIFNKFSPEVVITDIIMPGMDGLQLSEKIRESGKNVHIIILSGHSEFEYARSAIRVGIIDYLLKPVKINEIIDIVKTAVKKIKEEEKRAENEHNSKITKSEKLIYNVLSGTPADYNELKQIFLEAFAFKRCDIFLAVIAIDNWNDNHDCINKIKHFVNKFLDSVKFIFIEKNNGIIAIIGENFYPGSIQNIKLKLKELMLSLNLFLKQENCSTVCIGFGGMGTIRDLKKLYENSIHCLSHKLYMGFENIIFYDDLEKPEINEQKISYDEKYLKEFISDFNYNKASRIISDVLTNLKNTRCNNVNLIRNLCFDFKNILVRTLTENGHDFDGLFGRNISFVSDIPYFETIDSYFKWILDIYYLVINGLSDMKSVRHNVIVFKAIEYIKKNYNSDLTVERLSNYVQKSPDYFSRIFKKELGISFVEYINKIRVDEAKKLFKTTNLLAYQISERVGFQDYKYFVQVFKKMEGYSPSQLRKSNLDIDQK